MAKMDSLQRRILDPSDWLIYYDSARMNQIQGVLAAEGVREPQRGRLVRTIDRMAERRSDRRLWIKGERAWLLFTGTRFLQIKRKKGQRRPTLRQVDQLYG